ncbi:MAG TPA: hypothetical protein VMF69_03260 [Gemmataceae bacterium]|nr:hypothetical protein [Gemmataceae bacterium]
MRTLLCGGLVFAGMVLTVVLGGAKQFPGETGDTYSDRAYLSSDASASAEKKDAVETKAHRCPLLELIVGMANIVLVGFVLLLAVLASWVPSGSEMSNPGFSRWLDRCGMVFAPFPQKTQRFQRLPATTTGEPNG